MTFIKPMECTPVDRVPDDPEKWLYEVKLDGYRCCAEVRKGKSYLYSRYGNSWPERFPAIHAALAGIPFDVVLDGEIVAVDWRGRPSFQELQNWQNTRHQIVLYAFDVLEREGRDLRRVPLEQRKSELEDVARFFREPVRLVTTLDASLSKLIPQMRKLGLEGIIAKRRNSRYESGRRSTSWVKHRFNLIEEFVVGGYIPEDDTFGRLLIGVWEDDKLKFIKKLKNGFSGPSKKEVFHAIRPLKVRKCPFVNPDPEFVHEAVWVRPVRVVEVQFVEWTTSGKLRHASFRRLVG
jgi:DNA ligase D-like protein (predicted ligase)